MSRGVQSRAFSLRYSLLRRLIAASRSDQCNANCKATERDYSPSQSVGATLLGAAAIVLLILPLPAHAKSVTPFGCPTGEQLSDSQIDEWVRKVQAPGSANWISSEFEEAHKAGNHRKPGFYRSLLQQAYAAAIYGGDPTSSVQASSTGTSEPATPENKEQLTKAPPGWGKIECATVHESYSGVRGPWCETTRMDHNGDSEFGFILRATQLLFFVGSKHHLDYLHRDAFTPVIIDGKAIQTRVIFKGQSNDGLRACTLEPIASSARETADAVASGSMATVSSSDPESSILKGSKAALEATATTASGAGIDMSAFGYEPGDYVASA